MRVISGLPQERLKAGTYWFRYFPEFNPACVHPNAFNWLPPLHPQVVVLHSWRVRQAWVLLLCVVASCTRLQTWFILKKVLIKKQFVVDGLNSPASLGVYLSSKWDLYSEACVSVYIYIYVPTVFLRVWKNVFSKTGLVGICIYTHIHLYKNKNLL